MQYKFHLAEQLQIDTTHYPPGEGPLKRFGNRRPTKKYIKHILPWYSNKTLPGHFRNHHFLFISISN